MWTAACLFRDGNCLLNAIHRGRLHCWFTGPLFISLAAITVLFAARAGDHIKRHDMARQAASGGSVSLNCNAAHTSGEIAGAHFS
jgi:hypothetical protein